MTYRVIVEPAGLAERRGRGNKFFYRIEGLRVPLMGGLSSQPLLDACRQLKRMGAPPTALCALFHEGSEVWTVRCPIGKGAKLMVSDGRFARHHA